jgi:uncharacterized membrane-anchored protein
MKAKILITCVALQLLVLAVMAGQREWVRRTGRAVYFRTAPVDPRDVMRGDYVRLSYDISRVPRDLWRGPLPPQSTNFADVPRDTRVYASLHLQEDGVAQLVSLGLAQPREGLYIRGRTEASSPEQINIRYGLEALFVEQGKGLELEAGRNRNGIQVPLEVKARVSPSGLAVIQDHRWCALGMGVNIEFSNSVTANGQHERQAVAATVQLLNASSNDVAVVNLPRDRSLALVTDSTFGENPWRWTPQEPTRVLPEVTNVIVLKPGETHSARVSFDNPWWSISKTGKPEDAKPLASLRQDWNARFRFEYRPPDRAASEGLANGNLIWHGRLTSRMFSPAAGTD